MAKIRSKKQTVLFIIRNPDEVMDYKWIDWNEFVTDISANPERYTAWLQILVTDYKQNIEEILFS